MRILHVSHRHHVAGGSDAVFMNTTKLLHEAGHEVVPFCMALADNSPSPYDVYFPDGADTGHPRLRDAARYFWNRDAARQLRRLIAECGPFDIAHLHIYHGKQTPSILPVLKQAGIPIVQTLHEYKLACPVYTMQRGDGPCEACLPNVGIKPVLGRCKDGSVVKSATMLAEFQASRLLGDRRHIDRFICVSGFQRSVMERAGVPAHKLEVLHNAVDIPLAGPPPDGSYFLYFGRIERLKGVPTLLEAAQMAGVPLQIAGTGDWAEDCAARVSGLQDVTFNGFQAGDALTRLIEGARAVVVPSEWYENCPMSVLEAKARARAVIGTRIGGIPELIQNGIDGRLVDPGNVNELAAALRDLTKERALKMGAAARADARRRFSSGQHLTRLHTVYSDVIASQETVPEDRNLQVSGAPL